MEGKMIGKPKGPAYLFGALLFIWLSLALAVTPAGTEIRNQASATYVDSAGQPRTTTSNLVVTVVQQVYSFTITPDGSQNSPGQTQSGLPGSQVLFYYQVTNTGNGTDTINLDKDQDNTTDNFNFDLNNVEIFLNANCDGNLEAGEPSITSVTLAMGERACVIVRATIPSTANSGEYGNLNLTGTSQGDSSQTDTNNWARATATTAAALTAFKSASPTNIRPGDTITYTITYTISGSNVGGSAAAGRSVTVNSITYYAILIEDTIPNGLTVSQRPTGNAGAGQVEIVYDEGDGNGWKLWPTNQNVSITGDGSSKKVGMIIFKPSNPPDPNNPSLPDPFFPVGAQYTFSFQATVPNNPPPPAGTSYPNTATVSYDHDNDPNTPPETVTTNPATSTIGASYGVKVGPYEYPEGFNGPPNDADYDSDGDGNPSTGHTITRSGDTQTINSNVYSGTTVIFRHTLKNTGNTSDRFILSFSGQPSGWACRLVADDLYTSLNDPVGPVQSGGTYNFALRCQIPAGFTHDSSSPPITITVTAISEKDSSKSDTTEDKVNSVTSGYDVNADFNTNVSDPQVETVNPGAVAYFPFVVSNTGQNPDTYNLTANVPSGWTVVFYPDLDCDGNMDNPTPAPVTNTGLMNPNGTKCFIAAVQVPANAAPGATNVDFTVTSTTLPDDVSDTISGAVNVNLVNQIALAPDRAGTVTSPGTIEYTHTLINNSDADATCNLSGSGGSYRWTYQYSYSQDGGSTWEPWQPTLSGITINAGGSLPIKVRVLVPAGEPIGRTDVNTLTATCTVNGQNYPLPAATETTTVVGGELRLSKSAKTYEGQGPNVRSPDGTQAYPGDVIEYKVEAENIGTGDLKNVKIIDPLPSYTDFESVSATHTGFPSGATVLYSTDGNTWSQSLPTSLSPGQSIYVAVDTSGDGNITDGDKMPPGAKITLTFKVQVQ